MCQVHDALGFTNCQKHGFAIGAAAVSEETVKFFLSLDMKLLEMIIKIIIKYRFLAVKSKNHNFHFGHR